MIEKIDVCIVNDHVDKNGSSVLVDPSVRLQVVHDLKCFGFGIWHINLEAAEFICCHSSGMWNSIRIPVRVIPPTKVSEIKVMIANAKYCKRAHTLNMMYHWLICLSMPFQTGRGSQNLDYTALYTL
jgi:hypothetical protein